ncbi:hypothetical protein RB653_007691 [Dictyostelium firmibasis]|uniref:Uncharacterized protein n=1 Tax=Dictyostelium firmibasis TaxID=79012 RepID=A0AAN7YUW1_9MYCE
MMKLNTILFNVLVLLLIFSKINNALIKKESNNKEIINNNKKENNPTSISNYYEDEDEFDVTIKDCISILVPYGKCTKIKSPFKKCQYKSIFISSNSTSITTSKSSKTKLPNNNNNTQYTINLFENSKCYENANIKNKNKISKNFFNDKEVSRKKNELLINCSDKKLNKFNSNEIRVICPTGIKSQFDSSTSSISINTLAIISLLFLIFINKLIN